MKNRKTSKVLLTLLIFFIVVTMIPTNVFAIDYVDIESKLSRGVNLLYINTFMDYIKENYLFEVNDEQLVNRAIKGMFLFLDDHSDYFTPEEGVQLLEGLLGEYGGIGVYIEENNGYIKVKSTMKNSPGAKAGLKAGDVIISVDENNLKDFDYEKGLQLIQGSPGTKVKLGILREGHEEPIYIDVTREIIKINPTKYKIVDKNIAYIKINEFNPYTDIYLKEILQDIDKKGIKKVIVDVRNNPGGLLDQAIEVSRMFVPKGPVVHVRKKSGNITTYTSNLEKKKYDLVVLVNGYSASASEIFAGAIKDREVGTLVGTKTYGKGTVQSVVPLKNGGVIKMTTAEYLTPNKTSINGKGIEPHIVVENNEKEDLQLKKAVEKLKKK